MDEGEHQLLMSNTNLGPVREQLLYFANHLSSGNHSLVIENHPTSLHAASDSLSIFRAVISSEVELETLVSIRYALFTLF